MRISDWSSDVCSSDLGVVQNFTNFQTRIILGVARWVIGLINNFLNLRNRALAFVRALWSTAGTVFSNGVSRLATSAGRGLGRVVGFFSDLPGRIVRAIGSIGSLLYNAGRNVVPGLIDGIYEIGRASWRGRVWHDG